MLLDLPSFAGAADGEVVGRTASVSRSNFRLSRLIARVFCSSGAELARTKFSEIILAYSRGYTAWMEGSGVAVCTLNFPTYSDRSVDFATVG